MPWKKGDKWIGQVREGTSRIQKVFPSKAAALDWESQQRQTPAHQWQTRGAFSLGGLANEYLAYSKIKHSEKTFKEKRDLFKRFFKFQVDPNIPIQKLSSNLVLLYLQGQATTRSGYAANKDRKNLLSFMGYIFRYKRIINSCVAETEKFPEVRQGRYIPPEEDFWKVYEVAQGQDKTMLLA